MMYLIEVGSSSVGCGFKHRPYVILDPAVTGIRELESCSCDRAGDTCKDTPFAYRLRL
jgi:hypothetical protein